jgi:hypothetical protein
MQKTIHKILFVFFLSLFFFSCADSLPSIAEVKKTLVWEFHSQDSSPTQHLVLFLNLVSDERRMDYFELIEKGGDLRWIIENPEEYKLANKTFVGSSKIMMPEGLVFENANYELRYFDLADRMASEDFSLSTPVSLKSLSLAEISLGAIENKEYGQEFSRHEIVLYDILKNPLYVGKITEELESKEAILKKYPQTFSYREFYRTGDYSAVILCPEVFIDDTMSLNKNYE